MKKQILLFSSLTALLMAQTPDSVGTDSVPTLALDSTVQKDSIAPSPELLVCPGNLENRDNLWYRFWGYMYDRFDLIPELHMESDMSGFTAYKNPDFAQRYLLESNTHLNIAIASFKKNLLFNWEIEFCNGMARNQGKNVLFAPAEIDYGIVPEFEYRFKDVSVLAGLNHHCFHEIDKKEEKTVYWNRFFLGAGSNNRHMMDYWQAVREESGWTWKNRWSWFGSAGYYVKEGWGSIPNSAVNGMNDRNLEFHADFRMSPFKTRYWLCNVTNGTMIGTWSNDSLTDGDPKLFWQERIGAELALRKGKKGAMVFTDFYLDEMPIVGGRERFSKDRLVEFGFRFFI